jgi:hypothetical protein
MFPDILPNKDVADRWWDDLESKSRERQHRTDEEWKSEFGADRALPAFDEPLNKEEESRMRFAHSLPPQEPFVKFGP